MNIKDIFCTRENWDASVHDETVHVIPCNDQLEHTAEDTCPCQPFIEVVDTEPGEPVGWLVVHSAWDGRRDSDEPPAA